MTQDEVLNLAREADGQVTMWVNHSTIQKTTTFTFESPIDYRVSGDYPEMYHIKFLERFAKLVAAKATAVEREACAKVCDAKVNAEYATGKVDHNEMGWTQSCAIAIRARGKA
jgi:hypothetical protein